MINENLLDSETLDYQCIDKSAAIGHKKTYKLWPIVHNSFNTKKELETANDYQIIERAKYAENENVRHVALHVLFEKYTGEIIRQRNILKKKAYDNNVHVDTSCYLSDIYETFLNAVKSIKLERIRTLPKNECTEEDARVTHKNKWLFYSCLDGYLKSKNRDILFAAFNSLNKEVSFSRYEDPSSKKNFAEIVISKSQTSNDPIEQLEIKFEEEIVNNAVKNAVRKMTEVQRRIWKVKTYDPDMKLLAASKAAGVTRNQMRDSLIEMENLIKVELMTERRRRGC